MNSNDFFFYFYFSLFLAFTIGIEVTSTEIQCYHSCWSCFAFLRFLHRSSTFRWVGIDRHKYGCMVKKFTSQAHRFRFYYVVPSTKMPWANESLVKWKKNERSLSYICLCISVCVSLPWHYMIVIYEYQYGFISNFCPTVKYYLAWKQLKVGDKKGIWP